MSKLETMSADDIQKLKYKKLQALAKKEPGIRANQKSTELVKALIKRRDELNNSKTNQNNSQNTNKRKRKNEINEPVQSNRKKRKLSPIETKQMKLDQHFNEIKRLETSKKQEIYKLEKQKEEIIHKYDLKIQKKQKDVGVVLNELEELNVYKCHLCYSEINFSDDENDEDSDMDDDDELEIPECHDCGKQICKECLVICPGWSDWGCIDGPDGDGQKCCVNCIEEAECGKQLCSDCMSECHDQKCWDCGNHKAQWKKRR
eukprot:549396_1